MQIEFIGHAGFMVTEGAVTLLMDPWLNDKGAFDSAWFQFPCNHHYFELIREKMAADKHNYVYISHEHKDHFDPIFLAAIRP